LVSPVLYKSKTLFIAEII